MSVSQGKGKGLRFASRHVTERRSEHDYSRCASCSTRDDVYQILRKRVDVSIRIQDVVDKRCLFESKRGKVLTDGICRII